MSKIQVPPEVLIQVAEKFRVESLQMEWRLSSLDHQMETMLMWEGTTRQRFFEDYHSARNDMTKTIEYMNSISEELKRIAYRFILVDEELLPLALVGRNEEPKEWYEEAWDSLKGLGNDFVEASNERYDNRYASVWGFLDYWTAGIPKAAYQGYVDRASKAFASPNDFANYLTLGVHGTIRETLFPTQAWSKEHMASIFGSAGLVAGGALVKPKDVLRPSVKSEVGNGKKGLKGEADGDGGGVAKAEGPGQVQTGGRELSVDEYLMRLDTADAMYESFRNSNVDVQSIAKNIGMPENRVQRIKDHLFFKEHIKEHGVGRFEADYEIAQAWDRLQKGTFKQQDIDLLNHELFESKFEGIFKTDYRTAHDRTVDSGRPWYPPEEE